MITKAVLLKKDLRKQRRNQRREGEEGIVKVDLYKRAINKLSLKISFHLYIIL